MILIKSVNDIINSKQLRTFLEKLREENDFQSVVFLLLGFPIFVIIVFVKYEKQTAINVITSGIMQGSFYALLALGFSIIFGIARMFKLSIGGYFVLGAYTALWFRQMTLMNVDKIMNDGISDSTSFKNIFWVIIPLILFIIGLYVTFLNFKNKKYSLTIIATNLLLFVIQRQLLLNNYNATDFKAIVHAAIIQVSLIFFTFALLYIELSPKHAFTAHMIMNSLMLFAQFIGNMLDIPYSPALYFAGFLISIMIVAMVSMLVDRYMLEKIRSNPTNVIIITFGVALIIQSVIPMIKYPDNGKFVIFDIISRNLPGVVIKTDNVDILGSPQQTLRVISTIGSLIIIILVLLFLQYTRMGRAMRAVAQDEDAAWLVGINVRKVYLVTSGLGMGLAAAAAILTSPFEAKPIWSVYMGWTPLVFAIAVVTLGGLGSILGSVIAGLIIGFVEAYIANENIELSSVVPLIAILFVMIVRPDGLFGKKEEDE